MRGVVEGGQEPSTIYRDNVESLPPVLDLLTIVVALLWARRSLKTG